MLTIIFGVSEIFYFSWNLPIILKDPLVIWVYLVNCKLSNKLLSQNTGIAFSNFYSNALRQGGSEKRVPEQHTDIYWTTPICWALFYFLVIWEWTKQVSYLSPLCLHYSVREKHKESTEILKNAISFIDKCKGRKKKLGKEIVIRGGKECSFLGCCGRSTL